MNQTNEPERSTIASSSPGRSFFPRRLTRKIQDDDGIGKGPQGLTTVHCPDDAIADLVFVHGLNGGSFSTWTKRDKDFWPKYWLPKDEAFSDVRIHTFGYEASWSKESVLNIHDFAMLLLSAIVDSPDMGQTSQDPMNPNHSRLIFVAHSMGGLVVKEAFIIGHHNAMFKQVVGRISTIVFLATPHQGATLAQTLSRLSIVIPGQRPFVDNLVPGSERLQSINEEFPKLCGDINIVSFFETRPMKSTMSRIVEKESAVMNLPNERRIPLNTDHRDAAMYTSTDDPTYITVRNTLAGAISPHRYTIQERKNVMVQKNQDALDTFLSLSDEPDDIMMQDQTRLLGSCQWLSCNEAYRSWKGIQNSRFLWLCGRPGTGKSFLAGHVVKELRAQGADTCFFFFQSADNTKSTTNACLRSLAWQMAMLHPKVAGSIQKVMSESKEERIDTMDHKLVWKKLYHSKILQAKIDTPQFWVIDAMDECRESTEMMGFLARIQTHWPISVLVTCRDPVDKHQGSTATLSGVTSYTIEENDSRQDISLFLENHKHKLPNFCLAEGPSQNDLASQIMAKSGGCLLWVFLVCSSLQKVTREKEARDVLESVPSDMNALYSKIFEDMSGSSLGKECAVAFVVWTTYAFRPLTTSEMQEPIGMDLQDSIVDVEDAIQRSCGQIVYVDSQKKVRFVHSTVKEFLTAKTVKSEFAVSKADGHKRLAMVCLDYLISKSKAAPRARRLSYDQEAGREGPSRRRSSAASTGPSSLSDAFGEYASTFLFSHLHQVHSRDEEVFVKLAKFLGSNSVLHWIAFCAAYGNLRIVFQAGKTINSLLARRAQHSPPIGLASRQIAMLEKWGDDLVHLATKFARRLKDNPQAIHHLIPPFCPPDSAIRQQFAKTSRLSVHGLSARVWDDCLTTITYELDAKPNVIAAGRGLFAVGMMTPAGKIIVYDDSIFQEAYTLTHGEPVFRLAFSENGMWLASAGAKAVRIWASKDGNAHQHFRIPSLCIALGFAEADTTLRAATKLNQLLEWDVWNGEQLDQSTWAGDLDESMQSRSPKMAAFLSPKNTLCVVYRGEKLLLWDFELGTFDKYGKESGDSLGEDRATNAIAMSLSHNDISGGRVAVTYTDGDLVMHDMNEAKPLQMVRRTNATALASSPDGRTLAGADSKGNFTLFDLETLHVLYRVRFITQMLPKCMTFSADSKKFIEISGNQCRVWEPTVLLRADVSEEENSDTVSVSSGPQEIDFQPNVEVNITAMACSESASVVFCAREDGSVHVYDISAEPRSEKLFTQTTGCTINLLYLDEMGEGLPMILASGDESGRIMVWPVSRRSPRSQTNWTVPAEPLVDTRSPALGALRQVLVSRKHDRLLSCTSQYDTLWPVPKQSEGVWTAQETGGSSNPRWLQHPLKPELLICVSESQFRVCRWSDLSVVRSVEITLSGTFHRLAPLRHQKYFATVSKDQLSFPTSQRQRPSFIRLWDFDELDRAAGRMEPVSELDGNTTKADYVIGAFGSRLVLSTDDYWISSVELGPSMAELPFTRHFFVPGDWVSVHPKLIMGTGSNGEILVAKRSELAVIKRGLEVTEDGLHFNPRRGSSAIFRPGGLPFRSPGYSSSPGPSSSLV